MMLRIPEVFLSITYNGKQLPGSERPMLEAGANCQLFSYGLLAHFGRKIPPFRSSNLWEDEKFTRKINSFKNLDLMLYNHSPMAWGAHVGLYIGEGNIIHLSKEIGTPEIIEHNQLLKQSHYQYFIGAKRVITSIRGNENDQVKE